MPAKRKQKLQSPGVASNETPPAGNAPPTNTRSAASAGTAAAHATATAAATGPTAMPTASLSSTLPTGTPRPRSAQVAATDATARFQKFCALRASPFFNSAGPHAGQKYDSSKKGK